MLRRVRCVRRGSETRKQQKFTSSVLIAKENVLQKAEVKLQIEKTASVKKLWFAMARVARTVPPAPIEFIMLYLVHYS